VISIEGGYGPPTTTGLQRLATHALGDVGTPTQTCPHAPQLFALVLGSTQIPPSPHGTWVPAHPLPLLAVAPPEPLALTSAALVVAPPAPPPLPELLAVPLAVLLDSLYPDNPLTS
jgi:hypothetical protein